MAQYLLISLLSLELLKVNDEFLRLPSGNGNGSTKDFSG